MSTAAEPSDDPAPNLSPEEVYRFFAEMPPEQLAELADQAIPALDAATNRTDAETAVIKMSPFFLNCTFGRIPQDRQQSLRACLDRAETKFGSLADVLGLDQEENKVETFEPPPPSEEEKVILTQINRLCYGGYIPRERADASKLAHMFCHVTAEYYERFSEITKVLVQGVGSLIEQRHGPLETLAAEYAAKKRSAES